MDLIKNGLTSNEIVLSKLENIRDSIPCSCDNSD